MDDMVKSDNQQNSGRGGNKKKRKNRRSLRANKKKNCSRKLTIIGANAAGLSSKLESFNHILGTVQ